MRHEIQFLLEDVLGPVADAQPEDHPLFVVRDTSTVYETDETLDMQTPIQTRKKRLQRANFVGVASETTNPTPVGPGRRYDLQTAVSIRLEGLSAAKRGHIEHPSTDGVPFEAPFRSVFDAVQGAMYPDVGAPACRIATSRSQTSTTTRSPRLGLLPREFDVLLRGYTDTP